jgi:outer membrane protein assembly factor BamE (lipoprotein component of BamABCDE complex)
MTKVLTFIIFLAICGCSTKNEIHYGYTFNDINNIDEKIKNYKDRQTTPKDIENELGSPTFIERNEGKLVYFYIEDIFNKSPIIGEKKMYSRVLKIDFDLNNIVKSVEFYTVEGKGYFNKSDKTEVKGNKMGFFEQMQKNLTSIGKSSDS